MANSPESYDNKVIPSQTSGAAISSPLPLEKRDGFLSDIESKADYYSPMTYRNLLTFFTSSEFLDDSNRDFIPISQTKANPKMFVVGIIPPADTVTGKLLDRSATIAGVTGYPVQQLDIGGASPPTNSGFGGGRITNLPSDPSAGANAKATDVVGVNTASSTGNVSANGVLITDPKAIPSGANLPDSFWVSYVQMCQRLRVDPAELAAVIQSESGFNPAAQNVQNGVVIAQGLNQFVQGTATGNKVTINTWKNYATLSAEQQLPYTEYFLANIHVAGQKKETIYRKNFGGFPNPDGSLYASKAYIATFSPEDQKKFNDPDFQQKCCDQNKAAVTDGRIPFNAMDKFVAGKPSKEILARIEQAKAQVGFTPPPAAPDPSAPTPPPSDNGAWAGSGSKSAADAKSKEARAVNTDLNLTDIGRSLQAAQQAEIYQTAKAIENMRNTPPLKMLVNPNSFKISSEKLVAEGGWSRNGPIVEHWGDQLDKIEASGKLAAFLAVDANNPDVDADYSSPGLTRVARNYTKSFQNFLSLYLLYKNNGYLFTSGLDQPGPSNTFFSRLSLIGSIYIYYDSALYIGSFDSFNITETDDKPYSLEYNYQFTVRATFLLDRPDEFNYGNDKMFLGAKPIPGSIEALQDEASAENSLDARLAAQGGGPVALPEGANVTGGIPAPDFIRNQLKGLPVDTIYIPPGTETGIPLLE